MNFRNGNRKLSTLATFFFMLDCIKGLGFDIRTLFPFFFQLKFFPKLLGLTEKWQKNYWIKNNSPIFSLRNGYSTVLLEIITNEKDTGILQHNTDNTENNIADNTCNNDIKEIKSLKFLLNYEIL